ncbi:glucosamine-6-phosphate isomerase/6-phosphogluconolactonase [Gemella haemolysans]|uniref:Glucosamine-6-phosphate isomerase/6-phosphogluconolactonase n=1 Tax=Gemella haemolysans TaxID=1379 RepID=A0A133ZWH8_9BACL|nr:glucosamine-6-phosphate isomerase/6-phosphogluconolactonase [Gemella haemolysans]
MLVESNCGIIKNDLLNYGGEIVKYIVCNSETAVLNRMYDEFEKNLEDGAVICLPENIINTQFTNRMIDDNKMGKYRYKHVIMLGQREFADIDIEEKFGLYRYARYELFKKLDVETKNIYYPQTLNSNDCEEDLNTYKEVLSDNPIDVAVVFLGSDGGILDYRFADEVNKNLHIVEFSNEEKSQLQDAGMEIDGNKLISIGYENLMAARNLFVVVLGSDKRKYIEELFENEDSDKKTILSILNDHKNLFIFTDKEASYKSEEEVNRLIKQRQKRLEIKEREEKLQNEEKKKDR